MKRFALVLAAIIAIGLTACVSSPAKDAAAGSGQLVVLHINDFHGKLEADAQGQAGIAAIAAYVKSVRAANPNVLFVSAGDFNTGSMVSDKYDGLIDLEVFNLLGMDASAVGNHEFDKSPEALARQIAYAKFPFLAANIQKGGAPAFLHYIVKEVGGLKVGIFGITTVDTPFKAHPLKVAAYDYTDEIEAARATVTMLRELEGVDVVIGLFHTGTGDGAGSVTTDKIVAAVPGIDLVVDGHSHADMAAPLVVSGTPIVQAASEGKKVGHAVIGVSAGKASLLSWQSVPMNLKAKDGTLLGPAIAPDAGVAQLLKKYVDEINAKYAVQIATTTGAYELGDRLPRKQETALGNLVADAMVWKARAMGIKADFALMNAGGIRASIPAGTVTRKNAFDVLPFGNTLAYFTMTGDQVLELFANVGKIPQGNGGWSVMSADVRYTVDLGAQAVKDLTIGGKPVDRSKTYIVVTNDFVAVGGDGLYPVFKSLKFTDTFLDALEGLVEYMQKAPQPMSPATDGRLKLIPKP